MKFLSSCVSDVGNVKQTNQDSAFVKIVESDSYAQIAFAVVCDGMGGLEKGEFASSTVTKTLINWFNNDLPWLLSNTSIKDIAKLLNSLIKEENNRVSDYGSANGVKLGTTCTVLLIIGDEYLIVHVGDTRVYLITNKMEQLTEDQTFTAREVKRGNLTVEQAEKDHRRNVLLQCVGASESVIPEIKTGKVKQNSVFVLCSDGFRHVISEEEIYDNFNFNTIIDKDTMDKKCRYLVDTVKNRKERDNITVILLKCSK